MKPGIKTTEFWLYLAGIIIQGALAVFGMLSAHWAVAASTILAAVYTWLRGEHKASHEATTGSHKMRLKPGIQTSEFWLTVVALVLDVGLTCLQQIQAPWVAVPITGLVCLYGLIRHGAKREVLDALRERAEVAAYDEERATNATPKP